MARRVKSSEEFTTKLIRSVVSQNQNYTLGSHQAYEVWDDLFEDRG